MALVDKLRSAVGFPKRAWDRRTSRWGDILERAALAVALGFIFLGILANQGQTDAIQDGRRTSLRAVCAVTSAVVDAGRTTIAGGPPPSPKVEHALRKLGFPPYKQRQAAAAKQADLYQQSITKRVQQQTGVTGLVRANGTFDCSKLVTVAHAK